MSSRLARPSQIRALTRPLGDERIEVDIGPWSVGIAGLDSDTVRALAVRWGGFVHVETTRSPAAAMVVRAAGREPLLGSEPGEAYRIEGSFEEGSPVAGSYHFALCPDGSRAWRVAVVETDAEPRTRILDNALRWVVARLAIEQGGFALHGAGVLHAGQAYVFAGPSRSGKSTAVRLSAPATSLGDDFAVAVPGPRGWGTMAVPFDNAESAPASPPRGTLPLAGIWRLFQSAEPRVEVLAGARGAASLLACAAFPWAMPDVADRLADAAARFVAEGRFGHLHFRDEGALLSLIAENAHGS